MTHVPKLWCGHCDAEMKPHKNGVVLQADTEAGRAYYKVGSDQWACPLCGTTVLYAAPSTQPVMALSSVYDSTPADRQVSFTRRSEPEEQQRAIEEATKDAVARRAKPLP